MELQSAAPQSKTMQRFRTPTAPPPSSEAPPLPSDIPVLDEEEDEDALEAFIVEKGLAIDVYLAQKNRAEVQLDQAGKGTVKEWSKLVNTKAIEVHKGEAAARLREEVDPKRILESRFVHTRRDSPERPGEREIKSRWCIKGFKDPQVLEIEKQSPTLSADALAVVLQLLASNKWVLTAFLQGNAMDRKGGKVYVQLLKEGVPGLQGDEMVEVKKYVYGLADAPRQWWLCLSAGLEKLGMRRSRLDPCCFYWYQ